ncbi:MAG TPA: TonB-dependent receptor [Thermoanaerobaculia bacterium]|nr:TonB-dependent receptor [Thermoanaerobaculia bacterium]
MNRIRTATRTLVRLMLLVAIVAPGHLGAQTQSGQLIGIVTQDGNGLPGVRVTVSSPSLQGTRTTETDVNGSYNFAALPPGEYTADFVLEGMQSVKRRVNVTLAGTARADAVMSLSQLAEAITVTASAPSVVETTTIESNIQAATVENLPIPRTLLGTVTLAPGTNTNGPANATTISGAASFDSTFYINGTPVNEVLRGQPLDLFIEDALQETTVLTGGISAEYGRFTGGVVSAISKSGGNEFSGSLRDSLTNAAWAESTPLDEELLDKVSQTWEGTFGGKLITDRLWFFAAGRYQNRSTQGFFEESTQSFNTQSEQRRIEAKLTGQLTPRHSLMGSALKLSATITDRCLAAACWDDASLSEEEDQPQDLYSVNYNGIFTNNLLLEGFWSMSSLKFRGSGGVTGDVFSATPTYDFLNGTVSGASFFCSSCGEEVRESETFGIKPHYFLSTSSMGTHNIVAGVEHYANSILSNNHQSGSDFLIYNFSSPVRGADGSVLETASPGAALIVWWPILQDARPNDLATDSLFVNDKWDVNGRLSLNLGVRYDKNDATDSAGKKVADDSKISPRLGLTYDVSGNGRLRLNASYSQYASQIQAGNIADASSPAGSPSLLYWLYAGPPVTAPHDQFVRSVFDWFNSTGGVDNRNFLGAGGFLLGGGTNGVATQIQGSLESPGVDEIAFGVSSQIGRTGFVRLDYQDRKWNDFYENVLNLGTGTVFDPLIGSDVDRGLLTNSDDLERTYRAVILQGGMRITPRFDLAANYTWSRLRGNSTPETRNSGPVGDVGNNYYPEIAGYARQNPIGALTQDQRHKARAWATYDLPTRVGRFNFSLLERFDSGTSYSAVGTIDPIGSGVPDPGYINAAAASAGGFAYFFSDRGAFRFETVTATDLGLNYSLPIRQASFFAQADIINVFNENAQVAARTGVLTAFNAGHLATFDPFNETPVECPQGAAAADCRAMGAHWQKASSFGTATGPTDYQLPRTYRLSLGFKF